MPKNIVESLKSALFLMMFGFFIVYWTSVENETEKNIYIKSLEKTIATCLSDKEGVLKIGDEIYFCRAIPTGIKI